MSDSSAALVTLRQRLLQHVLTPLFVMWCLGTATTVGLAYFFTLKAFDRAQTPHYEQRCQHMLQQPLAQRDECSGAIAHASISSR